MEPTPSTALTAAPSTASGPPTPTATPDGAAMPSAPPTGSGFPGPPSGVKERRARHIGWRSRDILRGAALVLAVYYLLKLFWFVNTLVFVVFLGTLFGLAV